MIDGIAWIGNEQSVQRYGRGVNVRVYHFPTFSGAIDVLSDQRARLIVVDPLRTAVGQVGRHPHLDEAFDGGREGLGSYASAAYTTIMRLRIAGANRGTRVVLLDTTKAEYAPMDRLRGIVDASLNTSDLNPDTIGRELTTRLG